MKKMAFVYNPAAGTGKVRTHLAELIDPLVAQGYEVTLHPTTGRGDATRYVRQRATEFDRIVCAGGDGTLSEVVAGLLDVENPPTLGYIPTGTTNDFSHTLELPTDLIEAAHCAAAGVPHGVDVGTFNGKPFVYIAAFGLFSDVSYTTPQKMKNLLGHLAYVLSGIPQLATVTAYPMRVSANGTILEDTFIYGMVSDTISVGGLLDLNPADVRLNDGKLEVLLIRFPQNVVELNEDMLALLQHNPCKNIVAFQTDQVTFTSEEPIPWTLDGEFGGKIQQAQIHVLPQAVQIVTKKAIQALE